MRPFDCASARWWPLLRRALLMVWLMPAMAFADTYPSHPIRLVVPFAPGGTVDQVARLVQKPFQEQLGQVVIIDNRAGAGGTVGAAHVARAKPDGYTLLMVLDSHAAAHHIFKSVPYDPLNSFEYLNLMVVAPGVVITAKNSTVTTLPELMELGRQKKGGLNFASAGVGSPAHLTALMLAKQAGVDATHIPYGGGGPMITAVARGEVDYAVSGLPNIAGHLKGDLIKGIAIGTKARNPLTEAMPTISESFPGFEITFWVGLVAPAGMPRDVTRKITTAMQSALRTPELASRLAALGFEIVNSDSEQFTKRFQADSESFGALIRREQIKAD